MCYSMRSGNLKAPCRANGSIRYEFDWPSNAGLQRFIWPSIWVMLHRTNLGIDSVSKCVLSAHAYCTASSMHSFISNALRYKQPD